MTKKKENEMFNAGRVEEIAEKIYNALPDGVTFPDIFSALDIVRIMLVEEMGMDKDGTAGLLDIMASQLRDTAEAVRKGEAWDETDKSAS